MEDMIEQANEIQESLGRSYGVPEEIDEDELQAGIFAISLRNDNTMLTLSQFHRT